MFILAYTKFMGFFTYLIDIYRNNIHLDCYNNHQSLINKKLSHNIGMGDGMFFVLYDHPLHLTYHVKTEEMIIMHMRDTPITQWVSV